MSACFLLLRYRKDSCVTADVHEYTTKESVFWEDTVFPYIIPVLKYHVVKV